MSKALPVGIHQIVWFWRTDDSRMRWCQEHRRVCFVGEYSRHYVGFLMVPQP